MGYGTSKSDYEQKVATTCGVDTSRVSMALLGTVNARRKLRRKLQGVNTGVEVTITSEVIEDAVTVSNKINGETFQTDLQSAFGSITVGEIGATFTSGVEVDDGAGDGLASSHGDPIIHTFSNECYDLNQDGFYLASGHPHWDHSVYVAVYNDFFREIQITDNNNQLLLSISNLNEVSGKWAYGFKYRYRMCKTFTWKECEFSYHQYDFDAQIFRFTVQMHFHDYLDPSLKDGERGIHLDIYPEVYKRRLESCS